MRQKLRYFVTQAAIALMTLVMITGAHAYAGYQTPIQFLDEQAAQAHQVERPITRTIDRAVGATLRTGFKAVRGVARVASSAVQVAGSAISGASNVVATAAGYLGTNPTGWSHDWCGEFANKVLRKAGYAPSGSATVGSFASYGPHLANPVPGAIAILPGHVGFVEKVQGDRVLLVSGNNRHCGNGSGCTARTVYSRRAFVAFVMPRRTQFASLGVDQR